MLVALLAAYVGTSAGLRACGPPARPPAVSEGVAGLQGPSTGRQPPSVRLVDGSAAAGLEGLRSFGGRRGNYIAEDMGAGVAVGDYDGDGDPDLFLPTINSLRSFRDPRARRVPHMLLRNDGAGRFSDATVEAGLVFYGVGMGAVFADLDGDDRLDLVVTQFGPDLVYRNVGGGRFELVVQAGLRADGFSGGPALGDLDGDGDLDMYVPQYVRFDLRIPPPAPNAHEQPAPLPPRVRRILSAEDRSFETPPPYGILPVNFRPEANALYWNEGGLRFVEGALAAGVADAEGRSMQALVCDFDGDDRPDIFVTNDVSYNRLFLNQGGRRFTDASRAAGLYDLRGSMGATVADLNGDGRPDLVVSNYSTDANGLFLSAGPGARWTPAEELARIAEASMGMVGWGVEIADLDLDGAPELFVAQGHIRNLAAAPRELGPQPDALFRGLGGAVFEQLELSQVGPGANAVAVGRGTGVLDHDGDGDLDLLVTDHGRGPRLLRNESQRAGAALQIELRQPGPNTRAVGARVRVGTAGSVETQWVLAGQGYLGGASYTKFFTIPAGTQADWIEVRWPSGAVQRLEGPWPPGRRVLTRGR